VPVPYTRPSIQATAVFQRSAFPLRPELTAGPASPLHPVQWQDGVDLTPCICVIVLLGQVPAVAPSPAARLALPAAGGAGPARRVWRPRGAADPGAGHPAAPRRGGAGAGAAAHGGVQRRLQAARWGCLRGWGFFMV
jgi:hypothetical protein